MSAASHGWKAIVLMIASSGIILYCLQARHIYIFLTLASRTVCLRHDSYSSETSPDSSYDRTDTVC